MPLKENSLYHFYNQGNNQENIFFKRDNQLFFLQKFRKYVYPYCKVLAYCLMTNHSHFLLYTTIESVKEKRIGSLTSTNLSNGFRQLLSSYAQAINRQEDRSGSLFRHKTKSKLLESDVGNYPFICFHYIHQNPLNAGLVTKLEDWEFSSFCDYTGVSNGSLCDKDLAFELLDLSRDRFYEESYQVIDPEKIEKLL